MGSPRAGRSPRSGDRVRATTDDRDAERVEGILHIRHVPSLNYVQVNVVAEGHPRSVVASSIEVIREEEVRLEEFEHSDPLVGERGWRRLADIAAARDGGLLRPPRQREGGAWADMFAALEIRAAPMLEAGWRLVSTDREESWEFGDSVFYDLRRDATSIQLEYYEHGQLVAYDVDASRDDVDSASDSEPIFSIPASSAASAADAYRQQGWIG